MTGYYDLRKQVDINPPQDCSDFDVWINSEENDYSCALHPEGFPVFLHSDELSANDEYLKSDPFGLKEDLDTVFQKRRISCTIQLIKNHILHKNMRLLDIGCGQGHFTNVFKSEFPDMDVYALDHSISAIRYANKNFKDINFSVADAFQPPFADDSFDIVVCNNLWEHVPDPVKLAIAIYRILKTDGVLIVSTPSRYRLANIVNMIKGKKAVLLNKFHITEYSVGQVTEQLSYAGFSVERIFSEPIRERKIGGRLLKLFLSVLIRLFKSHHVLELTVFYAAIKLPSKRKSDLLECNG